MHCHTFFSFNAYGYSPTGLAWLAREQGWPLMGLIDFVRAAGEKVFGTDEAAAAPTTDEAVLTKRATVLEEHVAASWKEAVSCGTLTDPPRLDPGLMFEDVFAEMPGHLRRQEAEMREELAGK